MGSNGWARDDHEKMFDLMAQGRIAPVIDRVIPMTGIQQAMHDLQDRKVIGKVVLEIGQSQGEQG